MYIKELKLINYDRFALSGIKEFIYRPKRRIQIIVGTNGSGKSSLLEQLSPLPADRKEFNNGYKEITIEHHGKEYVLRSGDRYSFKVDGVELNETNKKTIQLELVQKHFGLTPKLHKLFYDRNFTEMSPNERKEWLTYISGINIDYVMDIFNKARKEHSNVLANIKLLTNKIRDLKQELLTEEAKEKIEKDRKIISHLINELNKHIDRGNPVEKPIDNVDEIINGLHSIEETSVSSLKEERDKLSKQLLVLETDYKSKTKQYNESLEYENKTKEDKSLLEKKLSELKETLGILSKIETVKLEDHEYKTLIEVDNISLLETLASRIDEISGFLYQVDAEIVLNEKRALNRVYDALNVEIEVLSSELSDLKNDKYVYDVTCPACNTTFKPNKEHEILRLESTLKKKQEEREREKKRLEKVESKVKLIEEKSEKLQQFNNEINKVRELRLLKEYLLSKDRINTLSELMSNINSEMIKIQQLVKLPVLKREIQDIELKLSFYTDNKSFTPSKEIDKELREIEDGITRIKEKIVRIDKMFYDIEQSKDGINKLKYWLTHVGKYRRYMIRKQKSEYTSRVIDVLKTLDEDLFKKLNNDSYNVKLHKEYQDDIDVLQKRSKYLKEIIKSLDFKDGIIGTTMLKFIRLFTENMNKIINGIWTYEIEMLPMKEDSNNLTYRFPMKVDGKIRDDISMGSKSMKEIIDVVFRIIVMRMLKITDYPLYLDEFASSFDDKHRLNAFNSIEALTGSMDNQIFLISHYYGNYGGLNNSDIISLSNKNIGIEVNNNNDVLITK